MGLASADMEPNNSILEAEEIGKGTHSGALNFNDYIDWYKVTGMGSHEVTIRGTLKSENAEDSIMIFSCYANGMPDGQTDIYLGVESETDYCHWKDDEDRGDFYLQVEGYGDYDLRISWGDDKFTPKITPLCIGCAAAAMVVVIALGTAFWIVKFLKGEKIDLEKLD
ncbi:MAG: hypothetical protein ACMUIG_07795 [Thermoplasmatota archaeon]